MACRVCKVLLVWRQVPPNKPQAECSQRYHKALGRPIWICRLFNRWIGYSKKNAFIYSHNFGNRLVHFSFIIFENFMRYIRVCCVCAIFVFSIIDKVIKKNSVSLCAQKISILFFFVGLHRKKKIREGPCNTLLKSKYI